jgi:hypothetical protein
LQFLADIWRVLGEDQGVIVEFDVIVGERLRYVRLAHDRAAVDQCSGLDKDFVDEDGVIG